MPCTAPWLDARGPAPYGAGSLPLGLGCCARSEDHFVSGLTSPGDLWQNVYMQTATASDPIFRVSFSHRGKTAPVTFTRSACSVEEAINSARHGFQWCYGYWNSEKPLDVVEVSA